MRVSNSAKQISQLLALSVFCLLEVSAVDAQSAEQQSQPTLAASNQFEQPHPITFLRPTASKRGADPQGCGGFRCPRGSRLHKANDYYCAPGEPVRASAAGRIEKIGWSKTGFYNIRYVRVRVSAYLTYETHYLEHIPVSPGDFINAGESLGQCAETRQMYPHARGMKNHVHQYVEWDGDLIGAEDHPAIQITLID
jgi:murein DD-endopeptidase MepM/ murein hydrolase activator NlpD